MQNKIPKIEEPEFYINYAFNKATKKEKTIKSKSKKKGIEKIKEIEKEKIKEISKQITNKIQTITKKYPNGQTTHQFHIEIIKTLTNLSELQKALESLEWATKKTVKLTSEHLKKINQANTKTTITLHKNTYYGRISSILKKIKKHLKKLEETRKKLTQIPDIKTTLPTTVIAGAPNVGKSTILKNTTKSKPQTATYPFTTKKLNIGHITKNKTTIQIIDTPGLLDRPLKEKNQIELQAITALKHLANKILYIFDPTPNSGYTTQQQLNIYKDIKKNFPKTPIIPIINKTDIATKEQIQQIKKKIENTIETNKKNQKKLIKKI